MLVSSVACAGADRMDGSTSWGLGRDGKQSCVVFLCFVVVAAVESASIGEVSGAASSWAGAGVENVGAGCLLVSKAARVDRSRSQGGRLVLAHVSRSAVAFFSRSFTSSCASVLPRLGTNASRVFVSSRALGCCPSANPFASGRVRATSHVASSFASPSRRRANASRARRSCSKSSPNVRGCVSSTAAPSRRSRARSLRAFGSVSSRAADPISFAAIPRRRACFVSRMAHR